MNKIIVQICDWCNKPHSERSKSEDRCQCDGSGHFHMGEIEAETTQNNTWQERFDTQFVQSNDGRFYFINDIGNLVFAEDIKSFITQELQRALQECLPEIRDTEEHIIDQGFNICRKQFINNAKSLGIIIE